MCKGRRVGSQSILNKLHQPFALLPRLKLQIYIHVCQKKKIGQKLFIVPGHLILVSPLSLSNSSCSLTPLYFRFCLSHAALYISSTFNQLAYFPQFITNYCKLQLCVLPMNLVCTRNTPIQGVVITIFLTVKN